LDARCATAVRAPVLTFLKARVRARGTLQLAGTLRRPEMEAAMFHALEVWLKRQRERSELEAMGAGERDRVARDLGVSTNDLDFLVRESHDPVQLPQMLEALGIDEAALRRAQPALLRDMRRTCSLCSEAVECRWEIHTGTAALTYEEFCPNREELRRLAKAG
jgi:hypothetical protein